MTTHKKITKILDGDMCLGHDNITPGSIKINGKTPPATMSFDLEKGTVRWTDQQKPGAIGPYEIEFGCDDTSAQTLCEDELQNYTGQVWANVPTADRLHILALCLGIIDADGKVK